MPYNKLEAVIAARAEWFRLGGTVRFIAKLQELGCTTEEILRLIRH